MNDLSSFWSRRRAAVQAEQDADEAAAIQSAEDALAQEFAECDDAVVLSEMNLPDPNEMRAGDDFSAFMSRKVPEHLRRQALRTLWRSNPVLACVDGLNDYDDDYRAAMLVQEPIKTAYQVGKGMLKHIEEIDRKAALAAVEDEAQDLDESAPDVEIAAEDVPDNDVRPDTSVTEVASETELDTVPGIPRRMRFRFEGTSL